MGVTRIQTANATAYNTYTYAVNLPSTPAKYNTLVATVAALNGNSILSIAQTGVDWYPVKSHNASPYWIEIWVGKANETPIGQQITIRYLSSFSRSNVVICEYEGLDIGYTYDMTGQCSATYSQTYTGGSSTTTYDEELIVGATATNLTQTSPINGFTLIDGQLQGGGYYPLSLAYLEKEVTAKANYASGTMLASSVPWIGCIATFKVATKILVTKDTILSGVGSKYTKIISSAEPILEVESNIDDLNKSAVIENLILEGTGNNTAISLENVCNCQIRNVAINNCKTGISVKASNDGWCESNNIKHVRMVNVDEGITFTCDNDASFAYTTLDNVLISMDKANGIGIQVGDGNGVAQLNGSSIKATCWINADNSTGIKVYGEMKNGITNIRLENPGGGSNTTGIKLLCDDYDVYDNHSFFITCGDLQTDIDPTTVENDIKKESL